MKNHEIEPIAEKREQHCELTCAHTHTHTLHVNRTEQEKREICKMINTSDEI